LKKRTKKLLTPAPSLSGETEAKTSKSFLLLFFKKEVLSFVELAACGARPFPHPDPPPRGGGRY
jgi:hypothetical protein